MMVLIIISFMYFIAHTMRGEIAFDSNIVIK